MVKVTRHWWIIITLALANFVKAHQLFDGKVLFNNNGFGSYSYQYQTLNGIYRREEGSILPVSGGESLVVRGEFSYVDPQGGLHSMKYIADKNGFQPLTSDDDTRFNDRRII